VLKTVVKNKTVGAETLGSPPPPDTIMVDDDRHTRQALGEFPGLVATELNWRLNFGPDDHTWFFVLPSIATRQDRRASTTPNENPDDGFYDRRFPGPTVGEISDRDDRNRQLNASAEFVPVGRTSRPQKGTIQR